MLRIITFYLNGAVCGGTVGRAAKSSPEREEG